MRVKKIDVGIKGLKESLNPEIEEKIPDNSMVVLLPDYDKELAEMNMKLAAENKETGQAIVYVRVEKLRASRIEGLTLQVP